MVQQIDRNEFTRDELDKLRRMLIMLMHTSHMTIYADTDTAEICHVRSLLLKILYRDLDKMYDVL